jgi:Family of unknown function (DUF6807)
MVEVVQGEDALVVSVGEVEVATYVFRPDAPASEAPKPYFHPLRSLSGDVLTNYRPWDHRWHKGLQMTWSHVSGENFWGGPTFEPDAPGNGYVWRDNLGRLEHEGFDKVEVTGDEVDVVERLSWIASGGDRWIDEHRRFRVHGISVGQGAWALDFATTLTNVRTAALDFGSPTTHGREDAGYTGLFWRGPRAWTDGSILGSDGTDGEDMMGRTSDWCAFSGEHDGIDAGAAVLFFAGRSSAPVPLRWFARSSQFAALAASPSYDEEFRLEPGESLDLWHRVVFLDGHRTRADLEAAAGVFGP